jgi:hypothetical protein
MGSDLLGGARGGGAEHEFERALAAGRVTEAAELAVDLARRRLHGVGASVTRVRRTFDAGGDLHPALRISLARELAMLQARAGRFDEALEAMTLTLSLAQETGEPAQVCEAEFRGAFFAVQVGELEAAHDLLDNAESHAAELGDDVRLGFVRVVRGVALLAEGQTEGALWLLTDAARLTCGADAFDRAFVLRQYARVLVLAGQEAAAAPLRDALRSAAEREDHTQLADCLETLAALDSSSELAARALGAAGAYRARGASARWADEADEAAATLADVQIALGFDRTVDLAAEGKRDPGAVTHAALALLET